jgi:hypothetical protein
VFGRSFHYYSSGGHASGEKDEIKGKLQEFRHFFPVAGNCGQSFWFEIFRYQFQQ